RVSQYNTVSNNAIFGGGRFLPGGEGTGIWMGSTHHNTVDHNDIHDFYNGAIELGQTPNGSTTFTHDNMISSNALYDLGQGVTSDMGCVHAASSNNQGNQIVNNVCHDVTQYQGQHGYGGHGIYLDSNTRNVVVKNNLVYRVSDSALFVNTLASNITVTNNIFAFAREGALFRGTVTPAGSFSASHNIFLYDLGTIQRLPSQWVCQGNCTGEFDLDWNLFWNTEKTAPLFVTTDLISPAQVAAEFTLAQWQSELGEDLHSHNLNPNFVNPVYPADNFNFSPNSRAAAMIGFVPFHPASAGPTGRLDIPPGPVPAAFPLQLLNRAKDF
ncbi:MAG TPA: right-handed parallel beta-helix repeat-containing protein, partial [Terriglobia bacterium]|nr:right-handed parallel beta-helix repeat-containing protein [Terriglobia bacterium]